MARGVNISFAMGHLTADARKIESRSGFGCTFTLATNRSFKTNGEWKEQTAFIPCKMWSSERIFGYLKKARQVHVEGHLTTILLEGSDGKKNTVMELNVDELILTDYRNREDANGGEQEQERESDPEPEREQSAAPAPQRASKRSKLSEIDPQGFASVEAYRVHLDAMAAREVDELQATRDALERGSGALESDKYRVQRAEADLAKREAELEAKLTALSDALPVETLDSPPVRKRHATPAKSPQTTAKTPARRRR